MERGFIPPPLRSISESNPVRSQVPLKLLMKFQDDSPIFQDGGPDFCTKRKKKPSGLRPRMFRSKLNFIKSFVSIKTDTAEHMLSLS
jgi:hypothetical protein